MLFSLETHVQTFSSKLLSTVEQNSQKKSACLLTFRKCRFQKLCAEKMTDHRYSWFAMTSSKF